MTPFKSFKSKQLRITIKFRSGSAMDYCFSNDSHNSTGSSSSSVVPNTTTTSSKGKKKGSNGNNRRVKLSTDPQSVAARERRHRISDRFKILQSLVPGGSKMDTVSMLEEAIHYVKFLKAQIWLHQNMMMMNLSDHHPNHHDQDHHHHHHNLSNFLSGTPFVIPSHQEGFYLSNSTNLTTTTTTVPLLSQPSAMPAQLPPSLSPPPQQAFQDFDHLQCYDHHQESMSLDEFYIKY